MILVNFAFAETSNQGIYSTDSSPFGIPYADWIVKWWQWNFITSPADHPKHNQDQTRDLQVCKTGQVGPVWFLPDSQHAEDRKCDIPAGKAILISLLSGECGYNVPELQNDDSKVIQCAVEGNEYSHISAKIDDVSVNNLKDYRIKSGFVNMSIPYPNIFELPPEQSGTWRSFIDGYFLFLEPLKPGPHTLQYETIVAYPRTDNSLSAKASLYNYGATVTWHINIIPDETTS